MGSSGYNQPPAQISGAGGGHYGGGSHANVGYSGSSMPSSSMQNTSMPAAGQGQPLLDSALSWDGESGRLFENSFRSGYRDILISKASLSLCPDPSIIQC